MQGGATFSELARLINGMLDEIEALLRNVAAVGDDIAHDLRTPLTNVRMTLERGRNKATSLDDLRRPSITPLRALTSHLTMVTALLRIAEIEHSRRLVGFRDVELAELVRDVADLYDPIAKDKDVALAMVDTKEEIRVRGDRDLLFEAIANLVDNAVKFTPECGHVELKLCRIGRKTVVRVTDTGRGIATSERDLVTRRFYRSDKSRGEPGRWIGFEPGRRDRKAPPMSVHHLARTGRPRLRCRDHFGQAAAHGSLHRCIICVGYPPVIPPQITGQAAPIHTHCKAAQIF